MSENNESQNKSNNESKNILLSDHQFSITLGSIFAAIAILIVIFVGIVGGVSILTILWRIFLYSIVFFAIGAGIGFLLKWRIPEITQITSKGASQEKTSLGENVDYITEEDDAMNESTNNDDLSKEEYLENINLTKPDTTNESKQNKIKNEYSIPDDPKILAQAVRTVMKRDE